MWFLFFGFWAACIGSADWAAVWIALHFFFECEEEDCRKCRRKAS